MGKKKQALTVTATQKVLGTAMLVCALIFLFYHSAMSVANKFVVYEGAWVTLQRVTFWLAIGAGALYVGYMVFFHPMKQDARHELRKRVFSLDFLLLLLLLLFMVISVISVQETYPSYDWWKANKETIFDMAGQILILFPVGCWLARHRDAKEFQWPLKVLTIAFLVFEGWVIYRTFTNNVIYLSNGSGIGMDSNLFLVISCHHNTSGLWGYCFLFLCLYLTVTAEKWLKPVYVLGILINLVIISLSKSRTSIYTNCLTLGLFAGILFWYQNKIWNKNKIIKIFASVAIGFAIMAAFYFLNNLIYSAYLKISNIEALLGVDTEQREFFDSSFNTRTDLWKACFQVMFSDARSFFFGVSPMGIYSKMNELANQNVYTHNQILEFGVGCGVPAMIVFIVFCVRKFLYSVRMCFTSGNCFIRNAMPSIGCFLLLVGNMMEATLFGFNYISGMIFIVLCGYMTEMDRDKVLFKKTVIEEKE